MDPLWSGDTSWKMQAEGFCAGDNKGDDFLTVVVILH